MTPSDRGAFFKAMPKGAELHIHLTGALPPEVWLRLAEAMRMEFQTQSVATLLRHIGEDPVPLGLDLSKEKVSILEMGPKLKEALGRTLIAHANDREFADFLKRWMVLGPMDRPEAQYTLLRTLADLSKEQGVLYLEVIVTSTKAVLEKAAQAARVVQAETGVTIRLLGYAGWYMNRDQVVAGMEAAHSLREWGVVGFNMVADEAKFRPLGHYEAFQVLRERMPGLAVALHAGEQSGTADNMVNDLLLGVNRYGHATHVEEDPVAMALLYSNKTPVEVSLISNQLTRVMPDLTKHPLPRLVRSGIPVSLSTDDPGIFASSLTQEYETAQRLYGLTWAELKSISRNGIRHSFLEPGTKSRLLKDLNRRLRAFERSELFRKYRTRRR